MLNLRKIKVGIAPIGWTNDDMPELGSKISFEQCIQEMAQAGYAGSEVGNKYPKDPVVLKNALSRYKLTIASQWFSSYFTTQNDPTQTIDSFKRHMTFLKTMGSHVIVISEQGNSIQGLMNVPIFGKKPVLDNEGWDRLVKGLETIGKLAKSNEMKIVYHHHMGTVIQSREEIDKLMQKTNSTLVWLLADTGHLTYTGGDPVKLIHDYAGRIAHIHLKDIRPTVLEEVKTKKLSFLQSVKAGVFTVPGDGCIDFKNVFKEIEKMNYEGWLIVEAEQDPSKANPLQYALKARKYIKDLTGL